MISVMFLAASIGQLQPDPWPTHISFPTGLKRYKPARYTQSIYTTGGFVNHHIDPVPRTRLEEKWLVPGGLVGVHGWRSDLYAYAWTKDSMGGIGIPNEAGGLQFNRGHRREISDGSYFVDVLSYKGKVFEHRIREKQDGKWDSYIAFKDVSARPPGYTGLHGAKCASCHDAAGTGASYGGAIIPGGDTVLSLPFDLLESGRPRIEFSQASTNEIFGR